MKLLQAFAAILPLATCDMYLQFPGGSNNRLQEENRNRNNNNRLFDSQNNNRFGYNQATYAFYTESEVNLRWTVQHSCGPDSNVNCQMVLQYACEDHFRDGETTNTIPTDQKRCSGYDCNTDWEYGMHEDFQSYQHCNLRERNYRVFPADQLMGGNAGKTARFTRQENNGQRFGYECNEERDYYPYWHPTIWKDILVMTDDVDKCDYFQTESENVKGRSYCYVPSKILDTFYEDNRRDAIIPTNSTHCEFFKEQIQEEFPDLDESVEWRSVASHGLPAPDCMLNQESRDNHHGSAEDSRYFAGYNWKIPSDLVHEQCAFRIRYNITSSDYDAPNTDVENTIRDDPGCMCRNNYGADMWSHLGWDGETAKQRGFRHRNDSPIKIFDELEMRLNMAYNTDQLGRVFEDRSFIVKFRPLPAAVQSEVDASLINNNRPIKIHNLNAMGKLGNYVEVYPNFEYDFVPSRLVAEVGDYLHIQWGGSNTNNNQNDGSQVDGADNTVFEALRKDRHNIVAINNMTSIFPDFDQVDNIFGLSPGDSFKLATDGVYGGDNKYLQASGSSFDLGLAKLHKAGKWYFMSSHNNRFGVRTQKGKVIVEGEDDEDAREALRRGNV